ncbi:HD domain-containing protein [Pseudalkalibacillus sp. SCS-8]|uniref:HD domain-containing protein n=1 Tax=Pseudalkalibacillus nanhaiensis TaxID=3115291 RepID=UPI0032DAB50C
MEKCKKAEALAKQAHDGQVRKLTGEPYVVHPISVAETLKEAGLSEDLIIAGYLHDAVEDTALEFEDIKREFGRKVVDIVQGNTEDKSRSWLERKQHTVDYIKEAPFEMKALIVADKLDNLKSVIEAYESEGDAIWEKFKGDKTKQRWYYKSIVENAFVGLEGIEIPPFFYTYKKLVEDFFGDV